MPMAGHSNGFGWAYAHHSGNVYQRWIQIEWDEGRKICIWFPNHVFMYGESFSKYGEDNPTGWQPLKDLVKYLKDLKEKKEKSDA